MKPFVKFQIRQLFVFFLLSSFFFLNYLIPVYAATSPWTQTDWSGGSGQTSWSDNTKFDSSSSVTTSTAGQVTIAQNSEKFSNTGFETDLTGWSSSALTATGGTITTSGGYTIHTFTSSGSFTPAVSGNVEYLVIAGGGEEEEIITLLVARQAEGVLADF